MTEEFHPQEDEDTGTALAEEGAEAPVKLTQTVELRDVGPCKKHIKVSVERGDVNRLLDKKFSELVQEGGQVRGFRPGKAPRKMIERHYQKEVHQQVKAEVLLQSLEQLAEEHDVAPLSTPDIHPDKIELPKDGPLVYEFEVEVRPQFDLPNYKGLKIRRPVKKYSEEDVDQEQKRILAPHGQLVPKDGSVETGDYITVDMTSRSGDRVIGELKEITIRVDPRLALKDGVAEKFGEQVQGAKAGDTRVVDIRLSDAVADDSLRGQTVQSTLAVKDVKTMRLPELTHEFLHSFGVHSVEQLREQIRLLLERRLEYTQRQQAREQVLGQITKAQEWELPRELLVKQSRRALSRRIMEMRSAGISEDEIRSRLRLLEQDVVASTAQALKEHFVLQKIAEQEKIDIGEDDLDAEIERMANLQDESPRRLRARLEKEDLMESLAIEIIERRALDLILDTAEYEDVPLGKEGDAPVTTVEEQAVPGEMKDPTAVPTEEPK